MRSARTFLQTRRSITSALPGCGRTARARDWAASLSAPGSPKRGVPAVLETATPSNVGLYQRLGYEVMSEWDVPKGGPHFWTMTNQAPAA